MKIVVLGKGFLGRAFELAGYCVFDRQKFNIVNGFNNDEIADKFKDFDVIINCIGKSDTRWCEDNFEETFYSNAIVPKLLSEFCKTHKKKFVHISTGCLYDRTDIENTEDEFLVAHCKYTITKWAGECYCNSNDLILRPRLFFGEESCNKNLLSKLLGFNKYLTETNSFTSVKVIVDATLALLKANQFGAFNIACDGSATVMQIANWIGLSGDEINAEQLRENENLYLVNNVMSLDKLKKFYQPPFLRDEVIRCFKILDKESK